MTESSHLQPGWAPLLFDDVPSFMGTPVSRVSEDLNGAILVIGMPFDGPATFRDGATRRGPQEIRRFSLLFGGYNLDWDMNAFEYVKVVDGGDVDVVTGDSEESFRKFESQLFNSTASGSGASNPRWRPWDHIPCGAGGYPVPRRAHGNLTFRYSP